MKTFFGTSILLAAFCLAACNSSNTLIVEDRKPVIRFEGGTVAYSVKAGREFRLAPEYENVDASTVYLWSCNGEILSRSATLSCVFDRSGRYDIRISAANDAGTSSADITLSVLDAAPPVISLDLPSEGLLLLAGSEYTFSPVVANADDDTAYEWFIGTETVARSREYLFMQSRTGRYDMAFEAANEDGSDRIEFTVEVVDGIAADATFEASYYQADPLIRYVAAGRSVELHPYIWNGIAPTFEWSIDGRTVSTDPSFVFTPQAAGQTEISFTLSDIAQSADRITRHIERRGARRGTVRFTVVCCDEPAMRPADASSSPHADKVFDYTPAPGQFINDIEKGGFAGQATYEQATAYAQARLSAGKFVSLGSWGGYIVVGFDHSVAAGTGNELAVTGNQIDTSSEPGIIWVMQDTNGNGLPDDEWFELKGSESGKPETRQRHAVRYTRPTAPHSATHWESIDGERGTVDYLASFHNQEYYYPLWVESSAMTLYGTRLASRVQLDTDKPMEYWVASPYGWGYADNYGCDRVEEWTPSDDPTLTPVSRSRTTYHSLSNAVTADGSPADLQWIDFVKIQTAVLDKCGHLGEISTEIERITDNTMK